MEMMHDNKIVMMHDMGWNDNDIWQWQFGMTEGKMVKWYRLWNEDQNGNVGWHIYRYDNVITITPQPSIPGHDNRRGVPIHITPLMCRELHKAQCFIDPLTHSLNSFLEIKIYNLIEI